MGNLRRRFYFALPQRAVSRCGFRIARLRGGPFTTAFIRWYIRHYGVNMAEAAKPNPRAYRSFSDFFTRALAPGARPIAGDSAIASPVDGVVSACGPIAGDMLFQAKGLDYSAAALLGNVQAAARYLDGRFVTLYLSPRDYHRVHAPLAGSLKRMHYIPGRLWPARPWAVESVPGLFAHNERLVLEFETNAGPYILVMIGALLVGGLETVVTGPIRRGRLEPRRWNLETAPRFFARGEEIGRFNFGSTVILLFPENRAALDVSLTPGAALRLGQPLGISGGP